jgi:hypothetical protein
MQASEFPETIDATFKLKRESVTERDNGEVEIVYHLDLEMFTEDAKRPVVAQVIIARETLDEVTRDNAIELIAERIKFDMLEGLMAIGILDVPPDAFGDDDDTFDNKHASDEPEARR